MSVIVDIIIKYNIIYHPTGNSSFGAIDQCAAAPLHFHWNQWGPQKAPQPQDPDASDTRGGWIGLALGIREIPFQSERKQLHQSRSERTELLSRTQCSLFWNPASSSISRRRPGRSFTSLRVRCSFGCGSLTTSASLSNSKPRNTRQVAGPSHLAGAFVTTNDSCTGCQHDIQVRPACLW